MGPWHAKYAGLKTSKPALVTKHGTAAVVLAEDSTSWTAGSPALSSKDMFAWPIHPGWACMAPLEGYLLNDLSAVQLGQSVFLLCPFIFLRFLWRAVRLPHFDGRGPHGSGEGCCHDPFGLHAAGQYNWPQANKQTNKQYLIGLATATECPRPTSSIIVPNILMNGLTMPPGLESCYSLG